MVGKCLSCCLNVTMGGNLISEGEKSLGISLVSFSVEERKKNALALVKPTG